MQSIQLHVTDELPEELAKGIFSSPSADNCPPDSDDCPSDDPGDYS